MFQQQVQKVRNYISLGKKENRKEKVDFVFRGYTKPT